MPLSQLSLFSKQVLSLASVADAAVLVDTLATKGRIDEAAEQVLYNTLLITEPNTIHDIYPDLSELTNGLTHLSQGFSHAGPNAKRYFDGLLILSYILLHRNDYLLLLSRGIEDIKNRLNYFEITDNSILAGFADLYSQTVSHLMPRIMIQGDQELLNNGDVQNKIRSLLLAGIRSSVLWTQYGGSRLKFGFQQRKVREEALKLLQAL